MQQLIEQLANEYNLTQEEATGIVNTVKNYLADSKAEESTARQPAEVKEQSMFEKAEHFAADYLPGGLKEKTEEMFSDMGNKVKGLFS